MTPQALESLVFPCPVVIDNREQLPFTFANLRADAAQGRRPIVVALLGGSLGQGDYSLQGFEDRITIERKSLNDLFNTLGQGRGRFQQELERLSVYEVPAVVCEADWNTIINAPPERSRLKPKVVFRSVIAWQQRFLLIHWWFCPGRRFAEVATFRILERFWKTREAVTR